MFNGFFFLFLTSVEQKLLYNLLNLGYGIFMNRYEIIWGEYPDNLNQMIIKNVYL